MLVNSLSKILETEPVKPAKKLSIIRIGGIDCTLSAAEEDRAAKYKNYGKYNPVIGDMSCADCIDYTLYDDNNNIVGEMSCVYKSDSALLQHIRTYSHLPSHTGSALMDYLFTECLKRGIRQVSLVSSPIDGGADPLEFYIKTGERNDKVKKMHISEPDAYGCEVVFTL